MVSNEMEKEESLDQYGACEKAYIIVLENCTIDSGEFSDTVTYKEGQIIPAQFNPDEYNISTSSKYESKKSGISQNSETFGTFKPPQQSRLTVKLLYDSLIQMDYNTSIKNAKNQDIYNAYSKYSGEDDLNKSYIKAISNLVKLTSETGRPPIISFSYGSTQFRGYMESVDVNFTRFNKSGEVIRAKLSLSINESFESFDKSDSSSNLSGISIGNHRDNDIISDEPLGFSDLFD